MGYVRIFVDRFPVFQIEKSGHTLTRGQLSRMEIPEDKWQEVSIGFITDFLKRPSGVNSIMTVIDKGKRMTHLITYSKTSTTARTEKLYWKHVANCMEFPGVYLRIEIVSIVAKFEKNCGVPGALS